MRVTGDRIGGWVWRVRLIGVTVRYLSVTGFARLGVATTVLVTNR